MCEDLKVNKSCGKSHVTTTKSRAQFIYFDNVCNKFKT